MYGVFFVYKKGKRKYLIERFPREQEAIDAKSKYIVGPGDKVFVKSLN
mgnify:CR=1 FL=1